MKLQEQQKIQEDIYNNPEKYFNENVVKIVYDKLPSSATGPKYRGSNVLKIKDDDTRNIILAIANIGNKIYIAPDEIQTAVNNNSNDANELSKYKKSESINSKNLIFNLINSVFLENLVSQGHFYQSSKTTIKEMKKYTKDKNMLRSLFKQQLLIENVIKDQYLNEFNNLIGTDNFIKFVKNKLSDEKMNSILNKYKPFRYGKIDSLHKHIYKQLEENKNIDPDEAIPDRFYTISLKNLDIPGIGYSSSTDKISANIQINKMDFKNDKFYYASDQFKAFFDKDKFEGIKGSDNGIYIKLNNKKDFVKVLVENDFFNNKDQLIKSAFGKHNIECS